MTRTANLDLPTELRLIAAARESVGIEGFTVPTAAAQAAKEELFAAYSGLIEATVRRTSTAPHLREECRAACALRLLELIATHDLTRGTGLASRAPQEFAQAVRAELAASGAFSDISVRERSRFYSTFFVKAGGDYDKALEAADADPRFTRDRFAALYRALVTVESVEGTQHAGERPDVESLYDDSPESIEETVEREQLVRWLLSHLDDRERLIVCLYFGFTTESLTRLRLAAGYQHDEALNYSQLAAIPEVGVGPRQLKRLLPVALNKMRAALEVTPAA